MGSRWLWPTLTLLLVTGLSGCFGGDDPVKVDQEETEAPEAVVTDDTGSIKGQVVSEDFTPLSKVGVSLTKEGRLVDGTTTDETGHFTLNGVTPDRYIVQTLAPGFEQLARPIDVVAGTVHKVDLQVTRLPDANATFVEPNEWTGWIGCGIGTAVYARALCSGAEGVKLDENDDFLREFTVEAGLKDLVIGMSWSKSGGVSAERFQIIVEVQNAEDGSKWGELAQVAGSSPILFTLNDERFKEQGGKGSLLFETYNETRTLRYRIFAPFTAVPTVIYQQPFTVHWDEFYHMRAPEGHSPIPDQ